MRSAQHGLILRGAKITSLKIALLGLSVLCLIVPAKANADSSVPNQAVETESQNSEPHDKIFEYFRQAAFVNDPLNKDSFKDWPNIKVLDPFRADKPDTPDDIKRKYPWLYPNLFPQDGIPAPNAITKWTTPVVISTGFPNDLSPLSKDKEKLFYVYPDVMSTAGAFKDDKTFPEIENQIKELATDIASVTGLDIRYLPQNEETNQNYGNVRIVFVSKDHYSKDDMRSRNPLSDWA